MLNREAMFFFGKGEGGVLRIWMVHSSPASGGIVIVNKQEGFSFAVDAEVAVYILRDSFFRLEGDPSDLRVFHPSARLDILTIISTYGTYICVYRRLTVIQTTTRQLRPNQTNDNLDVLTVSDGPNHPRRLSSSTH